MKTFFNLFVFLSFSVVSLQAQMVIGNDTLYGNEWIDYNKDYYKIQVAEDAVYRLSQQDLIDAGLPISNIEGNKFSMHHMGQSYPIYVSTDGMLGGTDFIEFVGRRNRTELDQHLYLNGIEDQLNTDYSLFNDTASYFLSWDNVQTGLQFDTENFTNTSISPQTYIVQEDKIILNNYHLKNVNSVGVKYSNYEKGEGFAGDLKTTQSFTFDPELPSSEGPDPRLDLRFGSNANTHQTVLSVNGSQRATDNFVGYTVRTLDVNLDKAELNASIDVQLDGTHLVNGNNNDRYSVSEVKLRYARQTNIEDAQYYSFIVEASGDEKYYEIETSKENPVIYDIKNNQRITPTLQGGIMRFLLAAGAERKIEIVFAPAVQNTSIKEKVVFNDYLAMDPEFLFISTKELQGDPQNNSVKRYVDHKSTKFRTTLVDIEQIYDQFGYGVERHAMSLRNFANYVSKHWSDLEYCLILGKGISYDQYRSADQINDLSDIFFVPTYGAPGSDNLIFSKGQTTDTYVTLGRLAAVNEQQIDDYLDKIKLHEAQVNNPQTIEDKAWMKNVIHMSGGDVNLQPLLANFLADMELVIEQNKFGANVTTFYKTSSAVLQDLDSDQVLDLINEGTSIITFFGHSSPGTFDFSIEDPDKWNNEGKNPVMISLGCYSGNIHNVHTVGLSEKFVLEPVNGAIGFMASSGTAYVTPQYNQGVDAYGYMGTNQYGNSIGNAYTEVRQDYSPNSNIDFRSLVQQMTYHGDPSILLHPQEAQDYVFDYTTAKINPRFVSSGDESFEFSIDVVNLGRNDRDTLDLQFVYQLPDGTLADTVNISVFDTIFRQNITVEFDVQGLNSLGENLILGEIDYTQKIAEAPSPAAENNNRIQGSGLNEGFSFYILDNNATPFSPCNYDLVADTDYSLKAATSNAYAPVQTFVMEIDTSVYFDSPSVERTSITQGGGVIEWKPNTVLENETVYYWRISPDSTSVTSPFVWQGASFTYKEDSEEGWNQQHVHQFEQDDLDGLGFDEGQNMKFAITGRPIEVINSIFDKNTVGIKVNNGGFAASIRPWRVLPEGVGIAVVNPLTGKFWRNVNGQYGSVSSGNQATSAAFAFPTETVNERKNIIDFIELIVPDDHYIFFFTLLDDEDAYIHADEWALDSLTLGANIFSTLEGHGATLVRQLETLGTLPYTYVFKKDVGFLNEALGASVNDFPSTKTITYFISDDGYLHTKTIGPATEWDRLQWGTSAISGVDSSSLTMHVFDQNEVLDSSYVYGMAQGDVDLSFINTIPGATVKLSYYNEDPADRTSSNLEFLRVLYSPYADLAINLEEHYVFNSDSLQRGENLEISFAIENDFSQALDSIDVKYSILTEKNQLIETINKTEPVDADGIVHSSFSTSTIDLEGENQMNIEINHDRAPLEKFRFNNIFIKDFTIYEDDINPILDITFDGVRILDGDLISAKPFIKISLKDENPYIKIEDQNSFSVEILYPNSGPTEWVQIDPNDPALRFFPSDNELTAYLEYTPEFAQEGEYAIRVQARDASGNLSAENKLKKSFNIILEEKISTIINYPNPFSTSTQFVFTLTGTEVPEDITIRIMTLSGKVVREITKEELGPLRIGLNRTDYKWNGTDEFGSKLANGVYLYKPFISDSNGETYKHLDRENIDSFFDKGFGKLVIMR